MIQNNYNLDGGVLDTTDGQTVQLDHCVQVFTVRVRTMRPLSPNEMMAHVQTKFEVVGDLTCDRRDSYYRKL